MDRKRIMLHERKAIPKCDIYVIYRAFLKLQTLETENRSVVSRGRQGGGKRVATGHTRGQRCSYSAPLDTVVVTRTDLVQNTHTHKWRWNWVRSEWAQCIVLIEKQGLFNKEKISEFNLEDQKKKKKKKTWSFKNVSKNFWQSQHPFPIKTLIKKE